MEESYNNNSTSNSNKKNKKKGNQQQAPVEIVEVVSQNEKSNNNGIPPPPMISSDEFQEKENGFNIDPKLGLLGSREAVRNLLILLNSRFEKIIEKNRQLQQANKILTTQLELKKVECSAKVTEVTTKVNSQLEEIRDQLTESKKEVTVLTFSLGTSRKVNEELKSRLENLLCNKCNFNGARTLKCCKLLLPFAIESTGVWGPKGLSFIKDIGRRIMMNTGESRSTSYLLQRISIAIQRGNAASILGTIPDSKGLDEVFYILNNNSNPVNYSNSVSSGPNGVLLQT